jgi:tetratricopeptide (TPR) repeat protein
VERARETDDVAALAEAGILLTDFKVGGNVLTAVPERVAVLEEAAACLSQEDAPLRARLLATLAGELFWDDDPTLGLALEGEAIAMARRLGDPLTLWDVLSSRRYFELDPRDGRARARHVDEVFDLATQNRSPTREFRARFSFRLPLRVETASPAEIDLELDACVRLSEQLRRPDYRAMTARMLAARALWQGRFAEAETLLGAALRDGRRADSDMAILSYQSALRPLRRMQGRARELESDLAHRGRLPRSRGHKWAALALHYAETGREELANEELAGLAADGFAALRRDSNYAMNLALLAETVAALADRERSDELYERLLDYAGLYVVIPGVVAAGCASRYLGLLATLLQHWDAAETHFEQALEVERRMRARPFEAYALRDYAALLEARREPGDTTAARRHRASAQQIASEIGLSLG